MAEGTGHLARPRRAYTKVLCFLVGGVLLVDLLLLALGFLPRSAFSDFGKGLLLAALGAGSWEIVERHRKSDGTVRFSAWLALPASMLLALASLPFLALSVYPDLEGFLKQAGRVRAYVREDSGRLSLELLFPRAVAASGLNLKLDSTPLPAAYASGAEVAGPPAVTWRSPLALRLDLQRLLNELGIPRPRSVGINMLPSAPRFLYEGGEPVPPQQVVIE